MSAVFLSHGFCREALGASGGSASTSKTTAGAGATEAVGGENKRAGFVDFSLGGLE